MRGGISRRLVNEIVIELLVMRRLRDGTCGVGSSFVHLGVRAVEEGGGFLKRETLGLDDEDVDEYELEEEPATVHNLTDQLKLSHENI